MSEDEPHFLGGNWVAIPIAPWIVNRGREGLKVKNKKLTALLKRMQVETPGSRWPSQLVQYLECPAIGESWMGATSFWSTLEFIRIRDRRY